MIFPLGDVFLNTFTEATIFLELLENKSDTALWSAGCFYSHSGQYLGHALIILLKSVTVNIQHDVMKEVLQIPCSASISSRVLIRLLGWIGGYPTDRRITADLTDGSSWSGDKFCIFVLLV